MVLDRETYFCIVAEGGSPNSGSSRCCMSVHASRKVQREEHDLLIPSTTYLDSLDWVVLFDR